MNSGEKVTHSLAITEAGNVEIYVRDERDMVINAHAFPLRYHAFNGRAPLTFMLHDGEYKRELSFTIERDEILFANWTVKFDLSGDSSILETSRFGLKDHFPHVAFDAPADLRFSWDDGIERPFDQQANAYVLPGGEHWVNPITSKEVSCLITKTSDRTFSVIGFDCLGNRKFMQSVHLSDERAATGLPVLFFVEMEGREIAFRFETNGEKPAERSVTEWAKASDDNPHHATTGKDYAGFAYASWISKGDVLISWSPQIQDEGHPAQVGTF